LSPYISQVSVSNNYTTDTEQMNSDSAMKNAGSRG